MYFEQTPGDGDAASLSSPVLGGDLFGQTTRFPANARAWLLSGLIAQTAQTDSKHIRRPGDGESGGRERGTYRVNFDTWVD